MAKCKKCGVELKKETPQMNGFCLECFADNWGDIVEKSPMVSPQTLAGLLVK